MIMNYLVVIFVINLLIFSFYSYFKSAWPEHYFGPEDKFALAISISLKRLLLFRILPVFLISILVFSYVDFKISSNEWILLGVYSTLTYALISSGVSLIKIFLNSPTVKIFSNKPTQISYHIVSICLLIVIGCFTGYIASLELIDLLSVNVRSLVDNVVAALLYTAIVIPAYRAYRYWTNDTHTDIDLVIKKSISEIKDNTQIYETLVSVAKQENANLKLVLAFCVVENIQRPRWFRFLENLILWKSTRGIMQVKSRLPISDKKSIELAVAQYFKGTVSHSINEEFITKLIAKYNGKYDEKYLLFIERAIYNIDNEWYQQIVQHT